ncbi:hypothetical protein C8R43DRAFT_1235815 [Mycena crocata]|nr:hypothetical protein C8R43DRAFT_1235815 [Mycena crocata]
MPSISSSSVQSFAPAPLPATDYTCDGCKQPVPAAHPRVHCLVCADHDLCAVCALGENFGGGHSASHQTTIYRKSGGAVQIAVASQMSISYGGTGNETAPPPAVVAPPASAGGTAFSQHAGPASPSGGWSPFFYGDMNPTPIFTGLMDVIFTHLDPSGSGYLTPEVFSQLLDDMGYTLQENAWKSNLSTVAFGQLKEDAADAALKRAFDIFSIDHITHPRPRPAAQNFFGAGLTGGGMPLITRRGLVSITAIELLSDPANEHTKLARAVALYGVQPYASWGPMPRGVLPPNPDPRMIARVAAAHTQARTNGQQAMAAAQMGAQIQAYANQAAVHAVGTTEYVYRY